MTEEKGKSLGTNLDYRAESVKNSDASYVACRPMITIDPNTQATSYRPDTTNKYIEFLISSDGFLIQKNK